MDFLKDNPFRGRVLAAVLLVAAAAVYLGSLGGGFVWDDDAVIRQNLGRSGVSIGAIFLERDTALPESMSPYYRPLTYLSFYLDSRLWGANPAGYHAENLMLHMAAVLLLFLLLRRASGDERAAFFTALLFAVHPAGVEPVSFLAGGRNTLLCAVLMLGSAYAFQRMERGSGFRKCAAPGSLLYGLSLISKESGGALLLFVPWWLWRRRHAKEALIAAGGLALVTAAYLALRTNALGFLLTGGRGATSPALVLRSLYEYFRLFFWPVRLNAFYRIGQGPEYLKWAVAVIGAGGLLWLALRRPAGDGQAQAPLYWGAAWAVLGFLPVINIVPIPSAPVAERYMYIPLMGLCSIAGYALAGAGRRWPRTGTALALLIALALAGRTALRVPAWHDNLSLGRSMVQSDPQSGTAHGFLGVEYMKRGDYGPAAPELRAAVSLMPSDPRGYVNLGNLSFRTGDARAALEYYGEALALGVRDKRIYYNLGLAAEKAGLKSKAAEYYAKFVNSPGVAQDPLYAESLDTARNRLAALAAPQPPDAPGR